MQVKTRVWVHSSILDGTTPSASGGKSSIPSTFSDGGSNGGAAAEAASTAAAAKNKRCPPSRSSSSATVATTLTDSSTQGDDRSTVSASRGNNNCVSPKSSSYEWREGRMTRDPSVEEGAITICVPNVTGTAYGSCNSEGPGADDRVFQLPKSALEEHVLFANNLDNYPADLVTLEHFNEPTVVDCLRRRFENGDVYTATGPILLAVNPFEHVPNLYGDDVMERYWEKVEKASPEPLPPHIYGIADRSFRSMMRGIELAFGGQSSPRNYDQCILVSGESGSGKTVTTKYIMKYLAALSRRAAQHGAGGPGLPRAYQKAKTSHSYDRAVQRHKSSDLDHATVLRDYSLASDASVGGATSASPSVPRVSHTLGVTAIEAKVLQSNPILESFGNARTVRNDNSSRFGKYIEMLFARTGRLMGTRIKTYLLEKVRVVSQSAGERNYHIFYELLSGGLSVEELVALHLNASAQPKDFRALSRGTYDRRDGVQDRDTFRQVHQALKVMGVSAIERANVYSIVAGILHASNLTFLEAANDGSTLDLSNRHLHPACELFGISPNELDEALCSAIITVRGSVYKKTLSVRNAEKALEAFLMACYGALFTHLVELVNDTISFQESLDSTVNDSARPIATIGVLDIFGFESFTTNSFEQLCINFCNEVLQQQFNVFMLKNEQAVYLSEGISWNLIKFPQNQDVLDLLTDRSNGLLPVLDDMCRTPGATDNTFAVELAKRCEENPKFASGHKQSCTPTFVVCHYAGAVEYSVSGFIEKNRDDLPRETAKLMVKSKNKLCQALGLIVSRARSPNGDSPIERESGNPTGGRQTVGSHFRDQVLDLRKKIDDTAPHYVRCIKPNANLMPGWYDEDMVAHQLRCGGVLQAVSITRAGFTLHFSHIDFVKRYGLLMEKAKRTLPESRFASKQNGNGFECKALVDTLLRVLEEQTDRIDNRTGHCEERIIQFGKSKVLLKHQAFESLELMIMEMQGRCATVINAWIRRWLCQVAFASARLSFREELRLAGTTFDGWFRENRELYYQRRDKSARTVPSIVSRRRHMFMKNARVGSRSSPPPFLSALERQRPHINAAPRNPAWIIVDGLWTRNPSYIAP
jgi:myosin-5